MNKLSCKGMNGTDKFCIIDGGKFSALAQKSCVIGGTLKGVVKEYLFLTIYFGSDRAVKKLFRILRFLFLGTW